MPPTHTAQTTPKCLRLARVPSQGVLWRRDRRSVRMVTTVLEVAAFVLIVAGAAAVVVGVVSISVPLAFIVGGCEAAALGFGGLWISRRVTG